MEIYTTGKKIRESARNGRFSDTTSGHAPNYVQSNVVILPKEYAFDFLVFCQRNPKPCPVIEVFDVGSYNAKISAPNSDIRTDVPRYKVYQNGELISEPLDILDFWDDNLVTFLLGCSFTFEHSLVRNGIDLPYYNSGKNVPMFITNIQTEPSGLFSGPLVVSQRWIPRDKLVRSIQSTSRFPTVHGAPIHIGEPDKIGIDDLSNPDYGDPYTKINHDDIPVFWACGVTPQAVVLQSKPKLMITHFPGHMFVTDVNDEQIAII